MRGPKYSILESMSCIYEVFRNHTVDDELKYRLIRVYSYLQCSRDDIRFVDITKDLNDEFYGSLQATRVAELTQKPFDLEIEEAIEHDEMTQMELSGKWRSGFKEYFKSSGDISNIK